MQLLDEKNDTEISGQFKTRQYTIKATAKAFKIIYSGLYKNKVRACIREYSVNGVDSHVFAGIKDKPIHIQLPNSLSPVFSITDFGTSLDNNEVYELFTSCFASNKTSSNDVTGAFGIGALSAFSYTDSFTVRAVKDGICRNYTMYLDDERIPAVSTLSTLKVQEPNSFRVEIPVQRQDFDTFRREAQFVFATFNPRPIVTGNSNFKIATPNPFMEDKGSWEAYTERVFDLFNESNLIVESGLVAYPIRLDQLGISAYNHWLFSNSYVVLHCPIGTVPPTASREEIEYLPKTVEYLKKRIEEIQVVYKQKLEAEIAKQPCYYDACIYYYKQPLRINGVTYNKKAINQYADNPLYKDNEATGIYEVYRFHAGNKKANPDTHTANFYLGRDTYKFYLEDTDKKVYTKVQNHLNSTGYGNTGILLKTQDQVKIKKFKDALGILDSHIIKVSTLPDPPKQVRTKSPKVGGYRLKDGAVKSPWGSSQDRMVYCWERLDDLPPKSIVVGFDQYYVLDSQNLKIRPQEFKEKTVDCLPTSFNIDVKAIYALSEKKFAKAPTKGFIDFWGLFDKALDAEIAKNKTVYEELLEYDTLFTQSEKFPEIGHFFKNLDTFALLTFPPLLTKIKKIYDDVKLLKNNADTQKVLDLANVHRKGKIKASVKLTPLIEELYQKAPMLHYYEWELPYYKKKSTMPDPVNAVVEYLRLVLK